MDCFHHLELTSVISTVLASISCSARTDRDCSSMKVQMARSGGTFYGAAVEGKVDDGDGSVKGQRQRCHKVSSCLSVGCGFQEAEAVPEALAGETEFDLFLQDGGGALQNHLVILWTTNNKHSGRRCTLISASAFQMFGFAFFFFLNFYLSFVFVSVFCSRGVFGHSRLNLIFPACIVCCSDLFWNEVAFFIRRAKGGSGGRGACSTLYTTEQNKK